MADRQIGAPMRIIAAEAKRLKAPLQACSMLSITKEHERTGSFMLCVGGQSRFQDAYLQLVIKRCHKIPKPKDQVGPVTRPSVDNWTEYKAVRD